MNPRPLLLPFLSFAALALLAGAASADPSWGDDPVSPITSAETIIRRQLSRVRGSGAEGAGMGEERDTIHVRCVSDKLSQIHATLRAARERAEARTVATKEGDAARAEQETFSLSLLREHARALLADSARCGGELTDFPSNNTSVTVVVSRDIVPYAPGSVRADRLGDR